MNINWIIGLSILTILFSLASEGSAVCSKRDSLFRIERSKNKNIVQYDACLSPNSRVSDSNPVHVYWILEDGKKEELSALEDKKAYGIASKKKLGENKFRIELAALKDRSLIVRKMKGDYKVITRIGGKPSILDRVRVQAEEKMLGMPEIQYIDLFGRSIKTNKPVTERITPN